MAWDGSTFKTYTQSFPELKREAHIYFLHVMTVTPITNKDSRVYNTAKIYQVLEKK